MTSTITCGDASVVVPRGAPGTPGDPGTSCSVVEDTVAMTKTITCTDGTEVVITDGDNASCSVVDDPVAGTATITCSDGSTATVASGAAGGGCTVEPAGAGQSTITCADGTSVTVVNGSSTPPGANVLVTDFHGEQHMLNSGEYALEVNPKRLVTAVITAATADAAGLVTVDFRVDSRDTTPVAVTDLAAMSATIAKLVPAATGEASNHWVPYIWRTETVAAAPPTYPNPAGTTALQGSSESSGTGATNGTLTNNGDGTYRYVFRTNLTAALMGTTPITYDRNLTHRVVIMMGGHAGPTADDTFDFVPDGTTAMAESRDIIQTATCQNCHNRNEFHGHGGNRLSIETCAVCHAPGMTDAQGGESLDLRTMIHKIHAGAELPSVQGADGIRWNSPATPADESADNGRYAIWGNRNSLNEWSKVGFPAVLDNCTKCHEGTGAQVDAWKLAPSRAACGSCHDDVNFATGANHSGGARANDTSCSGCHSDTDITGYHDFMNADPRNTPEFNATLTVNTPPRGYFIDGEAPVVTIALTDRVGGAVIPGTSVVEDPAGESCPAPYAAGTCTARDGLFRVAAFFVHGPRGRNVPVLTTAARAQVLSGTTGPFDLSAAGANLVVKIDGGRDLRMVDMSGADYLAAATITVAVSTGTFVSTAAATTDEIVTWLNANVAFNRRAIAFNQGGKLGIRSRNLGWLFSVQLGASAVASAVFPAEVTAGYPAHLPSGSTAANDVRSRTVGANNDPKATRTATNIQYQLDPVDDLEPGTYIAQIEFSDRGRTDATNYWTPTVAFVNIQVGTATEERPVARNCQSCHQSDTTGLGSGLVVDVSRHNKYLRDLAPDQCGGCHDQMPQLASSATSPGFGWTGSRPISHRVHGIHFGSSLTYPLATVDYANGDPVAGRNWDITFPQDVRNCESCHTATTSGTWATRPARLPCSGCHDSDAANGHMRAQTYDPTPVDPWSGDEVESCTACHAP